MKIKNIIGVVSLVVTALMLSVTSCRTIEKSATSKSAEITEEEILFSKIVEQQPKYETATIKCSVALDKISSKAQIKMINGEYIQISLQPLLGIEMFRIMITPDSLYVIDKINSLSAQESIAAIKNKLPQGCGIKELQKLILGQPFVVGDTLTVDKYSEFMWTTNGKNGYLMRSNIGESASVTFSCDMQGVLQNTVVSYKVTDLLNCEYLKRSADASGNFQPTEVSIKSNIPQLGSPISVKLTGISTEWNKKVVKETQVSSRYKRVSLEDIIGKYI
ncbi:MAG: DUF4292 domain-containing protein [Muribaculaceae bacterium]|nr:DUF4292 domain-containing protein [Muribaculaceae bacterium]